MLATYIALLCFTPNQCSVVRVSDTAPKLETLDAAQTAVSSGRFPDAFIRVERWENRRCTSTYQFSKQDDMFVFTANTTDKIICD